MFLAIGVMVAAILWCSDWAFRYFHVNSSVLLTDADFVFGFVVGPVPRSLPSETRRAFSQNVGENAVYHADTGCNGANIGLVSRCPYSLSRPRLPGILMGHRRPDYRDDPRHSGTMPAPRQPPLLYRNA